MRAPRGVSDSETVSCWKRSSLVLPAITMDMGEAVVTSALINITASQGLNEGDQKRSPRTKNGPKSFKVFIISVELVIINQ